MIRLKSDPSFAQAMNCFNKAVQQAERRTLRRVATTVRAEWARKIHSEINLPVSAIKQTLSVKVTKDEAEVMVHRKRLPFRTSSIGGIPLIQFKPRQNRFGVTVLIKKTNGRETKRSAFIAKMKSGHRGVFERETAERLPISQLYSSSITDIASNHQSAMTELARQRIDEIFPRELNYAMSRCS